MLIGGQLRVGDVVTPAPSSSLGQAAVRDVGTQPPDYYTRPSARTDAMVKGATAQMVAALYELKQTNPVGVARAEAAYLKYLISSYSRD